MKITNELVERVAHALYADVEIGPWELGPLPTLLAYRRAARVALEAARDALPQGFCTKTQNCRLTDNHEGGCVR